MSWTFPLFRLFGIPVRMHWTLALVMAGYLLRASSVRGLDGLQWMAITMGILFVSVLVHEMAHCAMAIRLGGHAQQVILWPLGGMAYVGHSGSPRDELRVAGIGPVASFMLGGAALGILVATGAPWRWDYVNPFDDWWFFDLATAQNLLLHAFRLNVILGLFNLCLPAYPLDGGRVLFAFLTMRHGRTRAAELTSLIAIPIGAALVIWGLGKNELMLILIGAWVLVEAFQVRNLVRHGMIDAHPGFGGVSEFDVGIERPARQGWFARWRERRATVRAARDAAEAAVLRERVDAVLEKVSREGIASLTADERRILEEASRRSNSRS
ncbi:MAG TPA: site-2 protease family protein [Planctomycetota bacterium]|nr:site-2 protease family protein [Planctomycetota bacterium]